jgi:hypothetical protein
LILITLIRSPSVSQGDENSGLLSAEGSDSGFIVVLERLSFLLSRFSSIFTAFFVFTFITFFILIEVADGGKVKDRIGRSGSGQAG